MEVPPSGQLEKHGENQRKQKKTIFLLSNGKLNKRKPYSPTRKAEKLFFLVLFCFFKVFLIGTWCKNTMLTSRFEIKDLKL